MKDLITTIGAVTILMVFVLQFCSNFVISTRVLTADKIISAYETVEADTEAGTKAWKIYQSKLAKCFACEENEIFIEEKDRQYIVKAPLKNIIACADFLGITKEANKGTYVGVINKK